MSNFLMKRFHGDDKSGAKPVVCVTKGERVMATAEEISRAYWKAEMAHDLDKVMSFYRPDATFTAPGVSLKAEAIRNFYAESFKAFPKLEHSVQRVMGNDRLACLEWTATLTDNEGRRRSFSGVNLAEVDGERFISVRAYFDRKELDIAGESNI
jgi:predicted ester cyclase